MGMAERLVESGAYRDLEEPVVVTSGEFLTPFFVNAEKLCGDPRIDAFLAEQAESDTAIIEHASALAEGVGGFAELIGEIAERVSALVGPGRPAAVSGGQRRDWLFSGPVSRRLGLPHVSLYKQTPGQGPERDRLVVRSARGALSRSECLRGWRVVHVVDMITLASSCCAPDPLTGREVGWIPMLREQGAAVSDLVAVISRGQGGEEALERAGVRVSSCVAIDEPFLRRHSRAPEEAVSHYRDPVAWTRAYLSGHGAGLLHSYLVEDAKKLPRLLKFAGHYRAFLESTGMWEELDGLAEERLGKNLSLLLGGEP